MNAIDLTTIDLDATGTVELRKLGGKLGIKGASKMRGQDLRDAIAPIKAEQVEEARKAKAPKAPKGRKVCSICGKRAVGTGRGSDPDTARSMGYCAPCLEEGEWENTHSDNGHEGNPDAAYTDDCWICHPELNEAQRETTARYGTSRSGMVMHVTRKMTAEDKANLVAKEMKEATIMTAGGMIHLVGTGKNGKTVDLSWDHRGRFQHKASTVGGKKVLNVSAALKALA